ncbi:outer membrane protein [Angulomicrobium tetraedrale]|uniref:Outer membrane protein n=1 Tax=Ancylobacter tetraedralis TaxID=217068 RepID=A0A839ZG07_9HYPH|nr:TolC family outer membrane protein [Ancylobacter tetraedralis]MBB3773547.1 outer membrane protein [Ancylobacter tetraedralis]
MSVAEAHGETLEQALASTYAANPTLNSQRAVTRATDEYVPIALAGYRPQVTGSASIGTQWAEVRYNAGSGSANYRYKADPSTLAITISQSVYDGLKTASSVRGAEFQVRGQRELLRNTEQLVLLDGVTAYMNVLQNAALLDLQKQNVAALREELRAARDRFSVGEVTRTDVAQAEASVASAESELASETANLNTANATFFQVIGQQPKNLAPGRPADHLLPASMDAAVDSGLAHHPAILASQFAVDQQVSNVKVAEAALSPTLSMKGQSGVQYNYYDDGVPIERGTSASATLDLTIPIYQGGSEYANIRKSKELLGQSRNEVEVKRQQVRANVVQYWGALRAARDAITSAQVSVAANEIALRGVREEWRVGQRTTIDVLNAQTSLFNARSSLVTAERDRVVASYSLLAAVGQLNARELGLKVALYNPQVHYNQVRDAWIGVRTP